jgi:S1-C subfamily serine protease
MGQEIKITDGIVSSKTGYEGDVSTYQISAPVQPGNSGGPLFSKDGQLIGITSSGILAANNVGYAIKASYLKNLMDSAPIEIKNIFQPKAVGTHLTEQIKLFTPYVVMLLIY